MSRLCPRQCIATNGTARSATSAGHLGVGQAAADVVDEGGAGIQRGGGDLGTHRVD